MNEFDDFSDIEDTNPLPAPKPSDETILSPDTLAQAPQRRRLEDLTLAELMGQFFRAPFKTWRGFAEITGQSSTISSTSPISASEAPALEAIVDIEPTTRPAIEKPTTPVADGDFLSVADDDLTPEQRESFRQSRGQFIKLGLYMMAYALAFWGSVVLVSAEIRNESQLDRGAPFLIVGFLLWLFAEFSDSKFTPLAWVKNRGISSAKASDDTLPNPERIEKTSTGYDNTWVIHPVRIFAGIGAIFFSAVAWVGNPQNQFTFVGFWGWLAAVLCIVVLFAPKSWSVNRLMGNISTWARGVNLMNPSMLMMIGIIIIATAFRVHDLDRLPPEMTSDHIEKLINVDQILNGDRSVFYTNNGGRESFQMYVLAIFSQLTGIGVSFTLLKVVAIIESIITLPFLWWLGREIIGEKDRKLGNFVGLSLMALVAVSYWHLAITRLSLRIILTPLVAALLLGFMIRALRYNRRGDFIMAGLVLGFGLYTYQAVRMMPVFIVLAVGWAVWCRLRQRDQFLKYASHLAVLVLVSFIAFIPLFRFSLDYPNLFWMRTAGRLLGDDLIQTTDENGNLVYRDATIAERAEAFNNNVPILADNMRNALLMYNWKGDIAWISAYPNYPAMDTVTGAFLIVGLGAWLGYMFRRKEGILLIVPIMVLVMLLPSALSIALPLENPSATRTSGSLPAVYLLAALPMGLFVMQSERIFRRTGKFVSIGALLVLVFIAMSLNRKTYYEDYYVSYLPQSLPHSEAGRILRGFALSDGAYSNAFMISYDFWFDHRTIGLEGGMMNWSNGIDVNAFQVPDFVSDAYYCPNRTLRVDVDKDLLFFYNFNDSEMENNLRLWFPNGRTSLITSYQPGDDFKIYRVPALGESGFRAFARQFTSNVSCAVP